MATLTKTVFFSKKALSLVGLALGAILILIILSRVAGSIKNIFFPPPPIAAGVAFDKIPQLDLSEGVKPPENMHYTVETISGDLPTLASQAKVFKIAQPVSKFGNLQDASDKAKGAGFSDVPKEQIGSVIKFADPKENTRVLTIDTISQAISLDSQFLNNPEVFTAKLKSQEDGKKNALNFFESLKLPIKDLPQDKIFLENYKVVNGILEKAVSLSDANLVKTVFTRDNVDSLPIINPNFDKPLIFALATDKKVVQAGYSISDIQKFKFSTYPLKGTKAAFEDLKKGGGALNKKTDSNVFPIRNVTLGYLETEKYQPYLQPVYIFASDDNLLAYVSAVESGWSTSQAPN